MEDITEMHKLEEEIRRSDKLASIGIMASGVAHEIRNPLGIVKTIAQTIKLNDSLSLSDLEGINIIIDEVNRANSVIKEILDFSKIEKGILKENSIYELIEDVKKIIDNYSKDKNVDIINLVEENIELRIDVSKMKQVFMNLIFNAIDAMPLGGKVTIKSEISEKKIAIEITDNGVGIKEENIKNIFDPFFTTRDVGTGLGLSITHKIVKEHNGSIRVKSKANEGSSFIIELPYVSRGEI
jgi:signal transduction histidine kinase